MIKKVSDTDSFADIGINVGRRGRPNPYHHLPLGITNEAVFDQYSIVLYSFVDLENGELKEKVDLSGNNDGKECRICHLKDVDDSDDDRNFNELAGDAIELGCECKGDLGMAHQKCAVTWFLIKGDLTCEICGALAQNVCGMAQNVAFEQVHEVHHVDAELQAVESSEPVFVTESEGSSLNGRRFVNVLLSCMLIAFPHFLALSLQHGAFKLIRYPSIKRVIYPTVVEFQTNTKV